MHNLRIKVNYNCNTYFIKNNNMGRSSMEDCLVKILFIINELNCQKYLSLNIYKYIFKSIMTKVKVILKIWWIDFLKKLL